MEPIPSSVFFGEERALFVLLKAGEEWFHQIGKKLIDLSISADNEALAATALKAGFRRGFYLVSSLFLGVLCPLSSLDFRLTITESPGILRNALRQVADNDVETVVKRRPDI